MTSLLPITQLCLQFDCTADARADTVRLTTALAATPFSSLIISGPAGQPLEATAVHTLVELGQKAGVATLIGGEANLARTLRADGVHLPWASAIQTAYAEARESLGTRYIVGADAGRSRHDAMALAEAGADYIGFGIPPHVEDRRSAAERRLDLCSWWAEIFEVPVMALDVEDAADAARLAAVRADFIAVRAPSGLVGDTDFANWLRAMSAACASPAAVSRAAVS